MSLVLEKKGIFLQKLRNIFAADYRISQLVRFKWGGPSSDAAIYIPRLTEGWHGLKGKDQDGSFFLELSLQVRRWVFNLDVEEQLSFIVSNVGALIYHILVLAQFEQLPAR